MGLFDSFSLIHSLLYSFIGFQTIYIATNWSPIYWNTACLVVNSGSLEEKQAEEEVVSLYEEEDFENYTYIDLPDRSGKKKIEKSSDYGKVAKALGDIIQQNIKISLIDINKSDYSFKPDKESNEILFGLKALSGLNGAVIEQIKCGRPYKSFKDFMIRCPLNKGAMISLIKGGAFDKLEEDLAKELKVHPRYLVMVEYLSKVCKPKTKLTLQNFNGLIEKNLVPESLELQKRTFKFTKYLKANCKFNNYYILKDEAYNFYQTYFNTDTIEIINGCPCVAQTVWEKIYSKTMDKAREWLKTNQKDILEQVNTILFKEEWDKYAEGNISTWEMESLCFYYHKHELYDVDSHKYGIVDFNSLSTTPPVEYFFKRNGKSLPVYQTFRIMGTVISKNDNKSSVTLLTTSGVVNVKFTRDQYAKYGKQISEKQADGTKKVIERGWFKRGTKLLITGFRREDMFVAKTYKNTASHQIYKIKVINNGRDLDLVHERVNAVYGED